jgi:endo-1,4-beta-xylanase
MKSWIKVTTLVTVLVLAVAVFFVMQPVNVDAGLAKTKFLGNIIAGSVPSNFGAYWNQVTPENGTKWGSVEGTRGSMNWGQADTAYNYARNNGFKFKFHTLAWGNQQPGWVGGLSATDQKNEVTDWIKQAGARYNGSAFVDVVNEPLHTTPPYANAIGGGGSTGWDWIVWTFQQARTAFPNSKLLINEYGIISDPNATSRYISIINILKSRGLIDGIGIQCHYFNMDNVSTSTMRSVLSSLAGTGLQIYVSELDMTGDDATQKARYQEKFPVLWEHPSVAGITLWGYIQGQTWATGTHIITSSGAERPALQWLKTYLGGTTPPPGPTPTPPPTGSYVRFRNVATGLYIDGMGSTGNGANCCQWGNSGSNNQQWAQESVSGYYKFKNRATGLYLDGMGRTSNGSICGQWSSSSSNNQQWSKETVGSNVKYKNRATGLYLDGMGSTGNGANLCQWASSGSTNQQWQKQ